MITLIGSIVIGVVTALAGFPIITTSGISWVNLGIVVGLTTLWFFFVEGIK